VSIAIRRGAERRGYRGFGGIAAARSAADTPSDGEAKSAEAASQPAAGSVRSQNVEDRCKHGALTDETL